MNIDEGFAVIWIRSQLYCFGVTLAQVGDIKLVCHKRFNK